MNGINNPIKRSKIVAKLKREKHFCKKRMSAIEHEKCKKIGLRNTFFSSHRTGKKRGVAILIPNSVCFELITEHKDKEGRFVLVKGKIELEEVTLWNVYAPPGSSISFFREIFNLIAAETCGACICAGDFNLLLNPKLDNKSSEKKEYFRKTNTILQELRLILLDSDF